MIAVRLAMIGTMVLWGVSFVLSKIVLTHLTPFAYMGIRFLAAALVFALLLLWRGFPRLSARRHMLIAATALAEPISYFLFETYGLIMTSATVASLVIATIPLMVMVFAGVFLGEPIAPLAVLAVFVSIGGIVLLVFGAEQIASTDAVGSPGLGVVLVACAVISAASYITLARHISQTTDALHLTALQTGWGALVFSGLWAIEPAQQSVLTAPPIVWGALAFLVFGATIGAFLLYNWALRYETAGKAALYINAIPVVTAVTAWAVLGERMSALQLVGAALVIVSVRIASKTRAT